MNEELIYQELLDFLFSNKNLGKKFDKKKEKTLNKLLRTPLARQKELVTNNLLLLFLDSFYDFDRYQDLGIDLKKAMNNKKEIIDSILKDLLQ